MCEYEQQNVMEEVRRNAQQTEINNRPTYYISTWEYEVCVPNVIDFTVVSPASVAVVEEEVSFVVLYDAPHDHRTGQAAPRSVVQIMPTACRREFNFKLSLHHTTQHLTQRHPPPTHFIPFYLRLISRPSCAWVGIPKPNVVLPAESRQHCCSRSSSYRLRLLDISYVNSNSRSQYSHLCPKYPNSSLRRVQSMYS